MSFGRSLMARLRVRFGGKARKRAARERAFGSDAWQREADVARRRYASYDEYVDHQRSKLDRIGGRLEQREGADLEDFVSLFASCAELAGARIVLCLGARLGTEVKALHLLGHFAVGVDLNPGLDNAHVLPGDFHALVFPDASADAVYTNALDHAFDHTRVLAEIHRVLRPGGVFILDLIDGFDEGYCPGPYESLHWSSAESFAHQVADLGHFDLTALRRLDDVGRGKWVQVVLMRA